MVDEEIKKAVRERYDNFAKEKGFFCPIMNNLTGYSQEEISLVPEVSRSLSRGCGNPTRFANLRPGEVVIDFGCGGGIDIFLASHKVGQTGKVIGVDFAPTMIESANRAIKEAGLKNAEALISDLESLKKVVKRKILTPPQVTKIATYPSEELIPPVTKEDINKAQGKIASLKFTAIKP